MKHIFGATLSIILSLSLSVVGGGAYFVNSNIPYGVYKASADTGEHDGETGSIKEKEDKMLLPSSTEQYLPLTSPSDITLTKNHIAIADGKILYIYDRTVGAYTTYTHDRDISKIQFSENELLYFSDSSQEFYTLNPTTLQTAQTEQGTCSTFTLYSDVVYFTRVASSGIAQICKNSVDEPLVNNIMSAPAIAHDNGTLYYTDAGRTLYIVDETADEAATTAKPLTLLPRVDNSSLVVSLAVYGGIVYYTDDEGVFYAYNLSELKNTVSSEIATVTPIARFEDGKYSALTVFDGNVYVVNKSETKSIKQYSPETASFTDYEISGSSDSVGRLSAATDLVLYGDSLIAADKGNRRISITDVQTQITHTFPIDLEAEKIATDGKTVMTANDSSISLYDLTDYTRLVSFSDFNDTVTGIAAVYGTYYAVTKNNYFYKISQTDEGWTKESIFKSSHTAKLLTADIYGYLYVSYSDGSVYRFTESEFMNATDLGELLENVSVPSEAEKISVDYDQNVYALFKNQLYACSNAQTKYPLEKNLVYSLEGKATSFAFGVESDFVYVLYDGNYIVQTGDVPLPNMKTIAVNGADKDIFAEESADFSVVKIAPYSLTVNFDIAALPDANYFPYLSYERTNESKTALKLQETDRYNIVAIFDENVREYTTALVLKESCTALAQSDYLRSPEGFDDGVGYLTNRIALYKYPYLTDLLTVCEMQKNQRVTVLGEIDTPDYQYYYVSFEDINGTVETGYIPKGYIVNFDGTPKVSETLEYGGNSDDTDSIWRMAFLLLGCASICILIDFLILHKPKQ